MGRMLITARESIKQIFLDYIIGGNALTYTQ